MGSGCKVLCVCLPLINKKKSENKFEYLKRKLKKLSKKLKRRRRLSSESDSSLSDHCSTRDQHQLESDVDCDADRGPEPLIDCGYEIDEDTQFSANEPIQEPTSVPAPTEAAASTSANVTTDAAGPSTGAADLIATATQQLAPEPPELDPELIKILGEDPTAIKEYGKIIQKDLAIRIGHIVTKGLTKEQRSELKEKYLTPENCKSIKAPALNPEIQAAIHENQAKRDRAIENKQKITSCALSALSEAITILLSSSSECKNQELLKLLMDTGRMLGDIQHHDSLSRRHLILSTVKKDLKDQLEKTTIDEYLFGKNLSETIKSAKIINKSGADLKPPAQKQAKGPYRPLNYRAPLASRRPPPPPPPGGARHPRTTQAPRQTTTTALTHPGASKMSSRQPQQRYRR